MRMGFCTSTYAHGWRAKFVDGDEGVEVRRDRWTLLGPEPDVVEPLVVLGVLSADGCLDGEQRSEGRHLTS